MRPLCSRSSFIAYWGVSFRSALALACLTVLSGCSYTYDLLAVVIHGRLAFVVDPNSKHGADCIRGIHVETGGAARAHPAADDDKALVNNGVFWWRDYAVDACPNPFPIFYGQRLMGTPFAYADGSSGVGAKPLQVDVIYDATTFGSGSGSGGGRFRILPDHRVENLPREDETAGMLVPANGEKPPISAIPINAAAP